MFVYCSYHEGLFYIAFYYILLVLVCCSYHEGLFYITFYYMGEKTERDHALSALWYVLQYDSICDVPFDDYYLRFDNEPGTYSSFQLYIVCTIN